MRPVDRHGSIDVTVAAEDPRSFLSQGDLADAISRENPDLAVVDARPMGAPGWDWLFPAVEVFAVYVGVKAAQRGVDVVTASIVDRIVQSAISGARSALRRERDSRRGWRVLLSVLPRRRVRAKRIVIYGPNNEVLCNVLVRGTDSEPEISGGDRPG